MGKTQYYTATTLDGYIADKNNSLDWLFQVDRETGESSQYDTFFAGVGAMAMGATTYQWVLDHEHLLDDPAKWQAWYGGTPTWVFTHRSLPAVPGADIQAAPGRSQTPDLPGLERFRPARGVLLQALLSPRRPAGHDHGHRRQGVSDWLGL